MMALAPDESEMVSEKLKIFDNFSQLTIDIFNNKLDNFEDVSNNIKKIEDLKNLIDQVATQPTPIGIRLDTISNNETIKTIKDNILTPGDGVLDLSVETLLNELNKYYEQLKDIDKKFSEDKLTKKKKSEIEKQITDLQALHNTFDTDYINKLEKRSKELNREKVDTDAQLDEVNADLIFKNTIISLYKIFATNYKLLNENECEPLYDKIKNRLENFSYKKFETIKTTRVTEITNSTGIKKLEIEYAINRLRISKYVKDLLKSEVKNKDDIINKIKVIPDSFTTIITNREPEKFTDEITKLANILAFDTVNALKNNKSLYYFINNRLGIVDPNRQVVDKLLEYTYLQSDVTIFPYKYIRNNFTYLFDNVNLSDDKYKFEKHDAQSDPNDKLLINTDLEKLIKHNATFTYTELFDIVKKNELLHVTIDIETAAIAAKTGTSHRDMTVEEKEIAHKNLLTTATATGIDIKNLVKDNFYIRSHKNFNEYYKLVEIPTKTIKKKIEDIEKDTEKKLSLTDKNKEINNLIELVSTKVKKNINNILRIYKKLTLLQIKIDPNLVPKIVLPPPSTSHIPKDNKTLTKENKIEQEKYKKEFEQIEPYINKISELFNSINTLLYEVNAYSETIIPSTTFIDINKIKAINEKIEMIKNLPYFTATDKLDDFTNKRGKFFEEVYTNPDSLLNQIGISQTTVTPPSSASAAVPAQRQTALSEGSIIPLGPTVATRSASTPPSTLLNITGAAGGVADTVIAANPLASVPLAPLSEGSVSVTAPLAPAAARSTSVPLLPLSDGPVPPATVEAAASEVDPSRQRDDMAYNALNLMAGEAPINLLHVIKTMYNVTQMELKIGGSEITFKDFIQNIINSSGTSNVFDDIGNITNTPIKNYNLGTLETEYTTYKDQLATILYTKYYKILSYKFKNNQTLGIADITKLDKGAFDGYKINVVPDALSKFVENGIEQDYRIVGINENYLVDDTEITKVLTIGDEKYKDTPFTLQIIPTTVKKAEENILEHALDSVKPYFYMLNPPLPTEIFDDSVYIKFNNNKDNIAITYPAKTEEQVNLYKELLKNITDLLDNFVDLKEISPSKDDNKTEKESIDKDLGNYREDIKILNDNETEDDYMKVNFLQIKEYLKNPDIKKKEEFKKLQTLQNQKEIMSDIKKDTETSDLNSSYSLKQMQKYVKETLKFYKNELRNKTLTLFGDTGIALLGGGQVGGTPDADFKDLFKYYLIVQFLSSFNTDFNGLKTKYDDSEKSINKQVNKLERTFGKDLSKDDETTGDTSKSTSTTTTQLTLPSTDERDEDERVEYRKQRSDDGDDDGDAELIEQSFVSEFAVFKIYLKIYIRTLLYLEQKLQQNQLKKVKKISETDALKDMYDDRKSFAEIKSNSFDKFIVQGIFETLCSKNSDKDCSHYYDLLNMDVQKNKNETLKDFSEKLIDSLNELNEEYRNMLEIDKFKYKLNKILRGKKIEKNKFKEIIDDITKRLENIPPGEREAVANVLSTTGKGLRLREEEGEDEEEGEEGEDKEAEEDEEGDGDAVFGLDQELNSGDSMLKSEEPAIKEPAVKEPAIKETAVEEPTVKESKADLDKYSEAVKNLTVKELEYKIESKTLFENLKKYAESENTNQDLDTNKEILEKQVIKIEQLNEEITKNKKEVGDQSGLEIDGINIKLLQYASITWGNLKHEFNIERKKKEDGSSVGTDYDDKKSELDTFEKRLKQLIQLFVDTKNNKFTVDLIASFKSPNVVNTFTQKFYTDFFDKIQPSLLSITQLKNRYNFLKLIYSDTEFINTIIIKYCEYFEEKEKYLENLVDKKTDNKFKLELEEDSNKLQVKINEQSGKKTIEVAMKNLATKKKKDVDDLKTVLEGEIKAKLKELREGITVTYEQLTDPIAINTLETELFNHFEDLDESKYNDLLNESQKTQIKELREKFETMKSPEKKRERLDRSERMEKDKKESGRIDTKLDADVEKTRAEALAIKATASPKSITEKERTLDIKKDLTSDRINAGKDFEIAQLNLNTAKTELQAAKQAVTAASAQGKSADIKAAAETEATAAEAKVNKLEIERNKMAELSSDSNTSDRNFNRGTFAKMARAIIPGIAVKPGLLKRPGADTGGKSNKKRKQRKNKTKSKDKKKKANKANKANKAKTIKIKSKSSKKMRIKLKKNVTEKK